MNGLDGYSSWLVNLLVRLVDGWVERLDSMLSCIQTYIHVKLSLATFLLLHVLFF